MLSFSVSCYKRRQAFAHIIAIVQEYNHKFSKDPFVPTLWTSILIQHSSILNKTALTLTENNVLQVILHNWIPINWLDHVYMYSVVFLEQQFFNSSLALNFYIQVDNEWHTQLHVYRIHQQCCSNGRMSDKASQRILWWDRWGYWLLSLEGKAWTSSPTMCTDHHSAPVIHEFSTHRAQPIIFNTITWVWASGWSNDVTPSWRFSVKSPWTCSI